MPGSRGLRKVLPLLAAALLLGAASLLPGGAFFHHTDAFLMIRGGHVDLSLMGAFEVSAEGDGAIAVVDIDTLWRERATGDDGYHWLGRTCKVYALMPDGWKMTMQTGALQY